jgi:hypothetical protein
MSKSVAILVVYWETDFLIKKCISQLLKTDYDNYKIYIIDNTWRSKDKLKSYFNSSKVKVIKGRDPQEREKSALKRGKQHVDGLNIGIKRTSSDYIAFFHADSWPLYNSWLKDCFKYINIGKVELVGIQHESSIHSCFHFLRRKILENIKYKYNKMKIHFTKELLRYIKHKDGIQSHRGKWDWGEDLSIKLYKRNRYTIGFNPTKGSVLSIREKRKNNCHWSQFGQHGYGIVYGDMFFHIWKSFRKMTKDELFKYKNFYKKDEYLDKYYYIDREYDKVVVNKGIHDNGAYLFRNFISNSQGETVW